MPRLIFVTHTDEEQIVDSPIDRSLMEAALNAGVPGIDADCGGACACATCHVMIDPSWIDRLDPPSDMEASMLECVNDPSPTSRLSCQIKVTEQLDGLRVRTPESQR